MKTDEQNWQVIEGCVEEEIGRLESISGWWQEGSLPYLRNQRELQEHQDALEFLREIKNKVAVYTEQAALLDYIRDADLRMAQAELDWSREADENQDAL